MIDWRENAKRRVEDHLNARNFRALWDTLSVPSNKVSRLHFAILVRGAPSANANATVWRDYLNGMSEGKLAEQLTREKDEWKRLTDLAEFELNRKEDRALAAGYPLTYDGVYFSSAMSWLSHLRDTGWIIAQKGIGTLTFDHPDGRFIATRRNKHLNAAYRLLQMEMRTIAQRNAQSMDW